MESLMATLHYLGQDDQNEVQQNLFVIMSLLALASYDANSIITGTMTFW